VRLIAPFTYRVAAAMERRHLGRNEAEQHVRQVDAERERWTRFLYGIDWNAPALYDLVLNLEMVSIETACRAIAFTAAQPEFQPTPPSRKAMRDLALQCRVRASLAADRATAPLELEVTADDGTVELAGKLRGNELIRTVVEVASRTPGVHAVRHAGLSAWHYSGG
jgi:hypothetical protein